MTEDLIPNVPIAGWEIGPVATGSILLRLPYFANAFVNDPDEATSGPTYLLSIEQAEGLRDALHRVIVKVKESPMVAPGPAH